MWAAAKAEKRASQARARRSMEGWTDGPRKRAGVSGAELWERSICSGDLADDQRSSSIACPKNRTPWLQECAFIPPFRSPLLIASQEEEADPHFEPVIKLTERVETKTHEEDEDVLFKMSV